MREPRAGATYLQALLDGRVSPPPYAQLLQLRLVEFGEGSATFELPITEQLYNPNGVVHGGAIASLLDTAMGIAIVTTLDGGDSFTTAEFHANFLRPARADSGHLRATGRVIQRGRQLAVAEAQALDGRGQLVARATSTNVLMGASPPSVGPPVQLAAQPAPSAESQVVAAQPPAVPPPPAAAPPSPLEHPPLSVTSASAAAIEPAALSRSKQRVRMFAGDMAFVRRGQVQGPAIILLHGIPSSSFLWKDVIDPLATRGYDVVAPDLLGYGDSDKRVDADLSVAAQARYVMALMELLGIRQAAVVGHDIGGGIAQLMAADEPDRIARLVLIDSIVDNNWPVPPIARLKEPVWDQIMVGLDLRKGFREGLEKGMVGDGHVTDELVDEWVRPFQDQVGRRAYLRAARALQNRDLVARSRHIEDIETPSLVLWGANDAFLEPQWGEKLAHKLRNATLKIIDPGGHFLPLDRPDAVTEAVLSFLAGPAQ